MTCFVGSCPKPIRARGMCAAHHQRWRLHGDVMADKPMIYNDTPRPVRFWSKVLFTEGCWEWTAAHDQHGYGRFYDGTKLVGAYRWAYEFCVAPIPDGLSIDHLCRNPSCVNPDHLEPVTHTENMRRGNGWSGRKFRQTHCMRGHEFDEDNTYVTKQGRRNCRKCHKDYERERQRALRAS